jgi:hypothetical protein
MKSLLHRFSRIGVLSLFWLLVKLERRCSLGVLGATWAKIGVEEVTFVFSVLQSCGMLTVENVVSTKTLHFLESREHYLVVNILGD